MQFLMSNGSWRSARRLIREITWHDALDRTSTVLGITVVDWATVEDSSEETGKAIVEGSSLV